VASGDSLLEFGPLAAEVPSTNYATFDVRNAHPCLDFDATTDETVYFTGVMPRHYAGGGITVTLYWAATSATSGSCRWEVAFERVTGQDIDSDSFATANSAGGTANATSGILTATAIAFTSGAQMDSIAVAEAFRMLVRRDANGTTGTDDMANDAELLFIEIKET
jgi:hypothetical protein